MKHYIYSQHDTFGKFFNAPIVSQMDPIDFAESVKRSISLCDDPVKLRTIQDCELVLIGEFDDVKGIITPVNHQVLIKSAEFFRKDLSHGNSESSKK